MWLSFWLAVSLLSGFSVLTDRAHAQDYGAERKRASECLVDREAAQIVETYLAELAIIEPLNCIHWEYLYNIQILDFVRTVLADSANSDTSNAKCENLESILDAVKAHQQAVFQQLGDQMDRCVRQRKFRYCTIATRRDPIVLRKFPHTLFVPTKATQISKSDNIERGQVVLVKAEFKNWVYVTGGGKKEDVVHGWLIKSLLDCQNARRIQ